MENEKKILKNQTVCFIITFCYYASFHASRSAWSYSKHSIQNDPDFNISDSDFGTMDIAFLFPYAIGMFLLGWIGDKIDLRIYLFISAFGAGISFMCVSLLKFIHIDNALLFSLFQAFNGLFQSMGWSLYFSIF